MKYAGLRLGKIVLLATACLVVSCNDAGFSGGSPASAPSAPPNVATGDANRGGPEAGTPVDPNSLVTKPSDVVENGDGTRSEIFFGRSNIATSSDVDIIFAMDTSGSMGTEKQYLEQNMGTFLTKLSENKRLNFQVFMIGANFKFPALDAKRFAVVNKPVGSWDALIKIREFLQNPAGVALPLRAKATKELVVVTDDDSTQLPADQFIQYLTASKATLGTVHLNGFVGLPNSAQNDWCKLAKVGNQYISIAANKEFGGELFDLCTQDWKVLFSRLAERIVSSSAQIEFALGAKADVSTEMQVFINDVALDKTFWTYSATRNSIVFDEAHAPAEGDKVSIRYKIAS